MSNLYATDGKCHNANRGTYGHECGKPAQWIGHKPSGFASGFCDHCKQHGDEAAGVIRWERRAANMEYVAYTYRGRTNGHRNKIVSHPHPSRELAAAELFAMLSPRQAGVETAIALPGGNIGGDVRPIYRHQLPARAPLSAADIAARQADYPRARD